MLLRVGSVRSSRRQTWRDIHSKQRMLPESHSLKAARKRKNSEKRSTIASLGTRTKRQAKRSKRSTWKKNLVEKHLSLAAKSP